MESEIAHETTELSFCGTMFIISAFTLFFARLSHIINLNDFIYQI